MGCGVYHTPRFFWCCLSYSDKNCSYSKWMSCLDSSVLKLMKYEYLFWIRFLLIFLVAQWCVLWVRFSYWYSSQINIDNEHSQNCTKRLTTIQKAYILHTCIENRCIEVWADSWKKVLTLIQFSVILQHELTKGTKKRLKRQFF